MGKKTATIQENNTPVQPVENPIICKPYEEPRAHWKYDKTGTPQRIDTRRDAGYWYKTIRTGSAQGELFAEEERDDLPLVNRVRADVKRWREAGYRGASVVTRELLAHWRRPERSRPLFYCQLEAAESVIYLAELGLQHRLGATGFRSFELDADNINRLLNGEKPSFDLSDAKLFPTLIDVPVNSDLLPLLRLGCKMATGSGKTIVMAMLISWAFCNRAQNPNSREFPNAVLVCCPNLTVKERLQVLRPEQEQNYYDEFDLVPSKYRPMMNMGKVLVTNWHALQEQSEHVEGDTSYKVVEKGPETPDVFARRVLGDLYDRLPIMVLNDEGHHCWRPAIEAHESLTGDEKKKFEEEADEARLWLQGLDWINNCDQSKDDRKRMVSYCVDLSATPFYIYGSGHPEGRPFPWLISDFGLVDAIESGIVKIPRIPVKDNTGAKDEAGRPDPKYFRLWKKIMESLGPGDRISKGKPKPEKLYLEAHGALIQIAQQWRERFEYINQSAPNESTIPPVLIVVCDNVHIAEYFYEKISGEREEMIVTAADIAAVASGEDDEEEADEAEAEDGKKKGKQKTRTVFGKSEILDEFTNTAQCKYTIRIDSDLLRKAETLDPEKSKKDAAEKLRQVVASVGKPGQPGEFVRCVVSVSMLTEGWDANNVTHILGLRAFDSQLLCEQVVGRGLRRMNYMADPKTGLLGPEYVDVYGIPFSVIPFKGRESTQKTPEDKPETRVYAVEERAELEMRYPVVEGFAFALGAKAAIRCDVDKIETMKLDPILEPTETFLEMTAGYKDVGVAPTVAAFTKQDRQSYYARVHFQSVLFRITQMIVDDLLAPTKQTKTRKQAVLNLQSRHLLFPQVLGFVQRYVQSRIDFNGMHQCELAVQKYVQLIVERVREAIHPDESAGEPPLLPILNRFKQVRTTADVDFPTRRPCQMTTKSHINRVVLDSDWEGKTADLLESLGCVHSYARNDQLGLVIYYTFFDTEHRYTPDFIVRMSNGVHVVLEIKGYQFGGHEQVKAKNEAAKKWVRAVNNWGKLGRWAYHIAHDLTTLKAELEELGKVEGGEVVVA